VLAALSLAGCAGYQAFREGQSQLADGNTEAGLAKLHEAMEKDPANNEYRRSYFTQRETAVNAAVREAERALELGGFAAARQAYERAAKLDPGNQRVAGGLDRTAVAERHWASLDAAAALAREGKVDAAVTKVQQVLSESPNDRRGALLLRQLMRQQADASGKELGLYPRLKAAYRVPVSLSFTNASLLQVFEALKQASGLNYMIERDVKPDLRVTLSVTNKPVEDILRLLLATNQLERRVLDDDTLLIYPNTSAKAAEYREMVVRSFYLNNAEANKVANVVKTIAKARDVVVDEKLNMLLVRDSADVIRLVEKLIASQDLAEPEVMLELEVLEVSVNRLLDLGIRWPDSVSAGVVGADGVAGQLRLDELRNRTADMVRLRTNDPLVSAQLRSQKGDANLLANPRVRVRNKQSAKILIGERVPVITTTSTANVGTSETVSYLDVGLKLDIEPTVSLDDEVSMKIALEVSNILETVIRSSGTQAYRLGTRNTSTSLRVRDGETNILAGLIQRDERRSNTGVPGLNEVPVVSRLFGAAQDSDSRTEIVLLITPHIVRNLDVPGVGLQEFLSGTESSVGASPIQLGVPTSGAAPARSPVRPMPAPAPSQTPVPPAATPPIPVRPGTPSVTPPGQLPTPVPPPLTAPGIIPTTPGQQ
ncbi:MAG TPA: secretin N-terminal domain-containing protein, partial [Albitalea sp.]|nr:secretin N-terminal domain-containing protein [Albitalea sp.]